MKQFVNKHMDKIIGTLTCFDRIIFKGYLPISSASGMAAFFHNQQWLIKDFKKQAPARSIIIKEYMQALAQKADRPLLYPKVGQRKEDLARKIAQRDNITDGLICVCCALEACSSFKIAYQKGRRQFQQFCTFLSLLVGKDKCLPASAIILDCKMSYRPSSLS